MNNFYEQISTPPSIVIDGERYPIGYYMHSADQNTCASIKLRDGTNLHGWGHGYKDAYEALNRNVGAFLIKRGVSDPGKTV